MSDPRNWMLLPGFSRHVVAVTDDGQAGDLIAVFERAEEATAAIREHNTHSRILQALSGAAPFMRSGDGGTRGGRIEMNRLASIMEAAIAKAEGGAS
mgnify:CR=1 FL=1